MKYQSKKITRLFLWLGALLGTHELSAQPHGPVSTDLLKTPGAAIAVSAYHLQPTSSGSFKSENPANNMRVEYLADGFVLMPEMNTNPGADWQVGMCYAGIGRNQEILLPPAIAPEVWLQENQLFVSHGNGLKIEYINTGEGMRQNFRIMEKPAGTGTLGVMIEIHTRLHPVLNQGREIAFLNFAAETPVLVARYHSLFVTDANGKQLEASMELKGNLLTLAVDDSEAAYPILVDPLSSTSTYAEEGNQVQAYLGWSAATAGDVDGDGYSDMIIGMPGYNYNNPNSGAAMILYGHPIGFSFSTFSYIGCGQTGSSFGDAVSSAGDLNADGYSDIVVGAPNYTNGQTSEGAVFVYFGSPAGISGLSVPVIIEGNQANAEFGHSVATCGDVVRDGLSEIMVGAWKYDNGQVDEGRVYIYSGLLSGTLNTTPLYIYENNLANSMFGSSVAPAGDVTGDGYDDIVIGAVAYSNGQANEGAVYFYRSSGLGLYSTPMIVLESNTTFGNMGYSVTTAGDVNGDGYADIATGNLAYSNGESGEGAAYIYFGSATGPAATPNQIIESNSASEAMGKMVAFAGDVNGDGYGDLAVGSADYSFVQLQEGSLRIYQGSPSGLSLSPALTIAGGTANLGFGFCAGTAGDYNGDGFSDFFATSPFYANSMSNEGFIKFYAGSSGNIETTPAATIQQNLAGIRLGSSVSPAGDVNGDGYADVIAGALFFSNGQSQEGAVYVHHGNANGINPVFSVRLEPNISVAHFGSSSSTAGDVNGDGYSDIIVGARDYSNGQTNEGAFYVYHGSPSGVNATAAFQAETNLGSCMMGHSVCTAGDVNGDGYSDVIVGAPGYTNGQTSEGVARIYLGSPTGITATGMVQLEINQASAAFGTSVASAGDINGDGYGDVVIGARDYNNTLLDEGGAFIFYGGPSGISTTYATMLSGGSSYSFFGNSVCGLGDSNGDGFSDIAVGAYGYDGTQTDQGYVRVYFGSATGINPLIYSQLTDNSQSMLQGGSVSGAGDVNGDGLADLIVSCPDYSNGELNEGAAYLYYAQTGGFSNSLKTILEFNQAGANMGSSVAGCGDVDGDGFGDVLVGAASATLGQSLEGTFLLYRGNEGRGIERKTRLYRSDLTTPIVTGGSPNHNGGLFGVGHFLRSQRGRTRAKIVWEAFGQGVPFSHSPSIYVSTDYQGEGASYTDIGVNGLEVKQLMVAIARQNKIRVRVKYHPASMIDGQVFSRWFYLGINDRTLISLVPVEIAQWSGKWVNETTELNWITASETNTGHFEIMRSSDGVNFEGIGQVPTAGNSTTFISYSFTDIHPNDLNYYRLRTVDINGDEMLSEIIRLDKSEDAEIKIWPNPATDGFYFEGPAGATLEIVTAEGKLVRAIENPVPGEWISAGDLARGAYLVRVSANGNAICKSLHIQ